MSISSDLIPVAGGWRWDHSYARLPESFFSRLQPTPTASPATVIFNRGLAEALGLDVDCLAGAVGTSWFAGQGVPEGADPIAQAYSGHQYAHFTTLGDGRALLWGEHVTPAGERFDVQWKGSGRTPYSRGGDGRAALGPMLREYILSEAMHGLGIPTTRSLAVATTGESVVREEFQRGAVLTRVAASHIRVGTFQHFAARQEGNELTLLAEYTLRRHFPQAVGADQPMVAMLRSVVERQASLVAQWLLVGFIHGVMNTDNVALSGETIDYGPCAFMDAYDPDTVFSSIDRRGRYAYGNQPAVAQWNLARLAESLLPLLDPDPDQALALANVEVKRFKEVFDLHWQRGMRAKLGIFNEESEDIALMQAFLEWMRGKRADYTNSFRLLGDPARLAELQREDAAFQEWHQAWRDRLVRQPQTPEEVRKHIEAHNPAYIPRNHRVEAALRAAEEGDPTVMERLLEVLGQPFLERPGLEEYRQPPQAGEEVRATFCGT
jgi:serine/tyrosine/threonine adenylyltransferase